MVTLVKPSGLVSEPVIKRCIYHVFRWRPKRFYQWFCSERAGFWVNSLTFSERDEALPNAHLVVPLSATQESPWRKPLWPLTLASSLSEAENWDGCPLVLLSSENICYNVSLIVLLTGLKASNVVLLPVWQRSSSLIRRASPDWTAAPPRTSFVLFLYFCSVFLGARFYAMTLEAMVK